MCSSSQLTCDMVEHTTRGPGPRLVSGGDDDDEVVGADLTFIWCSDNRSTVSGLNVARLSGVSCTETAGKGKAISRGSFVLFGVLGVSEGCCFWAEAPI